MRTFVTSDPHFGHRMLAEMRGFETVAEHDAKIVSNFNKTLTEHDTVWWLGDMAFGGWRNTIRSVLLIKGHHRLILGNHDRAHPLNSQGHAYLREYYALGFEGVSTFERLSYNGKGALMSHFPYSGDHTETDREAQWRLRDLGKPLFHGHTHSTAHPLSFSTLGTPQIHVGLDAWGLKPVSLHDAFSLIP